MINQHVPLLNLAQLPVLRLINVSACCAMQGRHSRTRWTSLWPTCACCPRGTCAAPCNPGSRSRVGAHIQEKDGVL